MLVFGIVSGIGMALANSTGNIRIINSTFDTIYASKLSPYGGNGLFIESASSINCEYYIKNCNFTNITKSTTDIQSEDYGIGNGGLSILFWIRKHTVSTSSFSNAIFLNNSAWQGGALNIAFHDAAHDVYVVGAEIEI